MTITVLTLNITCIPRPTLPIWFVASNEECRQVELSRVMTVTRSTKPEDIVNCIRVQFAEPIDYQVGLRVRNTLATNSLNEFQRSFQQHSGY